jgi:hypothetical protein
MYINKPIIAHVRKQVRQDTALAMFDFPASKLICIRYPNACEGSAGAATAPASTVRLMKLNVGSDLLRVN